MRDQAKPSRMRARDADPWVSVSLLGEAIFCDRAGRFQYEASQDDTGEESDIEPPRRGWYRRPFTVEDIERELRGLGRRILHRAILLGAAVVADVILVVTVLADLLSSGDIEIVVRRILSLGAMSALVFVCFVFTLLVFVSLARASFAWVGLWFLLQDARRASTAEPDPHLREPQDVDWWSLVRKGFECHRYEDSLGDRDWKLAGKPWRVLSRGNLRIPVFRKRNEEKNLYAQHFARIAAYAHLIERNEGAEVPYGVILLGSSYRGLAVPVHPGSKKQFHDALIKSRAIIASGPDQPPPRNTNRCRICPWGKPMGIAPGTFRSDCGARYAWVPPHQKAIRKGLV